jgi:hypothetical protein
MKNAYIIPVRKKEETLGRSRHRWEDKIIFNLKEIGCEFVD